MPIKVPDHMGQNPSEERFANPLFRSQPVPPLPVLNPPAPVQTEAVAKAVAEAEQGLKQLHALDPSQPLPPDLQVKLAAFSHQQQICQQHIANMQQSYQAAQGFKSEGTAFAFGGAPMTPTGPKQSISIASSPAGVPHCHHGIPQEHPDQRLPKVLKSQEGSVQVQPGVTEHTISDSPVLSPVPSMVPTEVAESEPAEDTAIAQLD